MKNMPVIKLENEPLWKLSNMISESIYNTLKDFPDEELWNTSFKLRGSANDLIFYVALGFGYAGPGGAVEDWSSARKHCYALKTMYRFAGRQKFIDLEPEIMVKIDEVISEIDSKLRDAKLKNNELDKKELEPWLKKYHIWKEIQK